MSERFLVGTRKGLFCVGREAAGTWKVTDTWFLGDPVTMTLVDPRDGAWYAALDHGHFGVKLHRSRDGGDTWAEIPAPEYPAKPDGLEDKDPMGRDIPWTLKKVWALEAAGPEEPGVLWCGTIPGGLFRSDDAGDSWRLVESLWDHPARKEWFGGGADYPGIHSICVHPTEPGRVLLGVSCGGAWESTDGGARWEGRAEGMYAAFMPPEMADNPNIQDPHRIVQCRARPECLWAQHHNGVFKTTDGGRRWTEVEVPPSSFGFAVAVHPDDPDTAWFVPAIKDEKRIPVDGNVVVARTRDGGASFEVLREGLPQGHAYDLTYRHALDIDATGDRLAFGSTTGSVWVTEDQGDAWRAVSHHLPPVYCLRFVP